MTFRRRTSCVLTCLLLAGCPAPGGVDKPTRSPRPDEARSPAPAASPSAGAPASTAPLAGALRGRVVLPDGKPAVGVDVGAYIISDGGLGLVDRVEAPLVSDQGGGLVSNNGGGVLSNGGGKLIGQTRVPYTLAQARGTAGRTDADGRFALDLPAGVKANLEARGTQGLKAAKLGVGAEAADVVLTLAPTGKIEGRVRVPDAPGVTNLEGADVFVPGLPYAVKTDATGRFVLLDVPAGDLPLVASRPPLGQARATAAVAPGGTATVTLDLVATPPKLTALDPAYGLPGEPITIRGERFGASTGDLFEAYLGDTLLTEAKRADDGAATFTIPAGARSADVLVKVAGVVSAKLPLAVLAPAIAPGAPQLLVGQTQAFSLVATRPDGTPHPAKDVTWEATGAIAVDAAGLVTAKAAGQGLLTAKAHGATFNLAFPVYATRVHRAQIADLAADVPGGAPVLGGGVAAIAVDGGGAAFLARRLSFSGPLKIERFVQGAAKRTVVDDPGGWVHLAREASGRVAAFTEKGAYRFAADGTATPLALSGQALVGVEGVAGGADGTFWAIVTFPAAEAGKFQRRLVRIGADGVATAVAGSAVSPVDGATTSAAVDGQGDAVRFDPTAGLAWHPDGYLLVASNFGLRKATPDGTVGPAPAPWSGLKNAIRMWPGAAGGPMIYDGALRRVAPDGTTTAVWQALGGTELVVDEPGAAPTRPINFVYTGDLAPDGAYWFVADGVLGRLRFEAAGP